VFAQIGCTSKLDSEKRSVKTCLHANKQVSIVETWEADGRFGSLVIFNNRGEEIANYGLRSIGGHASAHLEYYANGQVSKIEFSDAPDGGIQFYNSTRKFDEQGKQIDYNETRYPHKLETTLIQYVPQEEVTPTESPKKQEVIACAVIHQTFYQIENTTNRKLLLTIQPVVNNVVQVSEKEIELKPNESSVFDTILMADQFVSAKIYQVTIKQVLSKKHKKSPIKVIEPGPIDAGTNRTYYWFIVE
jgi:hypothetical protein